MCRPAPRRLVQLYCALLYNAHLRGFATGRLWQGGTKAFCVPGLNCYSCPGAVAACPLGALQNALAASGHTAGWYVFGILMLFGVLFGRTVCGWLCPAGLIQELLHRIPTPKIRKSRVTRMLTWAKYLILAVFVLALPLAYGLACGLPLPAFCKYICPAGTLEGTAALLANPANDGMYAQLGLLFTNKAILLLAIGLLCIFCWRAFCRFLCPLGALYSLFNRIALTGIRVDADRCDDCGACVRVCGMDIRHVNDRECIACGKCVGSCPRGAISLRCGRLTLMGPQCGPAAGPEIVRTRRRTVRTVWAVLMLILMAALVWFNLPEPPGQTGTVLTAAEDSAPEAEPGSGSETGPEVGQQLEDFTCTLMNGEEFRLTDCRGRVVFINQWATYCTPCVEELPAFERLQEEHPEIVVLAVHHWLEASPAAADYIAQMGWDGWQIHFTVDTGDQAILSRIHGDNTMPRTVVLNRRGEVVCNEQRSVTYEMLNALLEMAEAE